MHYIHGEHDRKQLIHLLKLFFQFKRKEDALRMTFHGVICQYEMLNYPKKETQR